MTVRLTELSESIKMLAESIRYAADKQESIPKVAPVLRDGSGFGERLKKIRLSLGMDERDLAIAMRRPGLNKGWVISAEAGMRNDPKIDTLLACAQALGVTMDYLYGGVNGH